MFANDCYTYCNGENIKTILKILQPWLHVLQNWSKESDFKFSPTISQCIIFDHKHKIIQQIYLKNSLILINKTIKTLGITFDSNLKWTINWKLLNSSCKNKMNVIKTHARHTWETTRKSLLSIYKYLLSYPKLNMDH